MPTMSTLPPELHDPIIDAVRDAAPGALGACASVCRAWQPRAHYHLFSSTTVRDACGPKAPHRDSLIRLLSASSILAFKIFALTLFRCKLDDSGRWEARDLGWITSLANLHTLTLSSPYCRCTTVSMHVLLPVLLQLPSLESLLNGVFIGNRTRITAESVPQLAAARRGFGSLQHVQCKVYIPVSLKRHIYPTPIEILFNELVKWRIVSPANFKTLDLPQHLPWGSPQASQAFMAAIRRWKIERFGALFVERRAPERPTERHARDMLNAIGCFRTLRSLDVHFIDKKCFEEYFLVLADLPQLPSAFVDSLVTHFAHASAPHPGPEEPSFTIAYPPSRLVSHWKPALERLARSLCDRKRYPRFRGVRVRFLVRNGACEYPWPKEVGPSPSATKSKGKLLFSAFEDGGVRVDVEVETFWVEGVTESSDGWGTHFTFLD
ncbi:uncharacterized protein BXZ73DRAFT_75789 [Epithele typhae]|uniref:uncharacterized protein n=1 Tax=Epithele typhae TaxID=378194 RepID=UPI002007F9D5|nr:uncharacterized protein BXZ73DRAFT_75789 [Epithele typhae]KAH9940193.1 hypothetical protein BXZ73DRAFT_75789 [Epithele typhae]